MKNYLFSMLVLLSTAILTACGGGGNGNGGGGEPGSSVLLASGGAGTNGNGGTGGRFSIQTTGTSLILVSGSVDASFVVSLITPTLGPTPAIVSSGTCTVQLNKDDASPGLSLYTKTGDSSLYLGNGDGRTNNDPVVTGLAVNAGAALTLVDQNFLKGYGAFTLANDLIVEGTVTTDAVNGLSIDANLIIVENNGRVKTTADSQDTDAKEIRFGGQGLTKKIINRGILEAKGTGSGNGGSTFLSADILVVNFGTIDTSGGSSDAGSGGRSGPLTVSVKFGDFYSSGTIRANGGNGGNGAGGTSGNILIQAALQGNSMMNGDIIISGVWEANGGNGVNGDGGTVNGIVFETAALGNVFMNWTLSARGGNSLLSSPSGTAYSGARGGDISIKSNNASDSHVVSPGKIRISGQIDVRGGDGERNGGAGGSFSVLSNGSNAGHQGIDVDFLGFPSIIMNGGTGAIQGGSGNNPAFSIQFTPPENNEVITGITPTVRGRVIGNEANIQARGGDSAGTGGLGGYVELRGTTSMKPWYKGNSQNQPGTPAKRAIAGIGNGGSIDVSGGNGEIGGSAYNAIGGAVYFVADYIINVGDFTARGGNGTVLGGNGGNIALFSHTGPTANNGTAYTAGGTGGTTTPGSFYIDGMAM